MRILPIMTLVCAAGGAVWAASNTPVTFNKDILPVLQKNCQECAPSGEIAPMSLLTYTDARPWAKARRPWFRKRCLRGSQIQGTDTSPTING